MGAFLKDYTRSSGEFGVLDFRLQGLGFRIQGFRVGVRVGDLGFRI